jgi:hypothetical protein
MVNLVRDARLSGQPLGFGIDRRDLGSLRIYYNPTATEIADRLG